MPHPHDHHSSAGELRIGSLDELLEQAAGIAQDKQAAWHPGRPTGEEPPAYRIALGRETIQLGLVEFRLLLFLASRPYHPFSRRAIITAVSTPEHPLSEENLDDYIGSLRDQLGFFHDYVQTVPQLGYRFKA